MPKLTMPTIGSLAEVLRAALSTWDGRFLIATFGLGLVYLSRWIPLQLIRIKAGSDGFLLILAAMAIAVHWLWRNRDKIAQMTAEEGDLILGRLLIIGSIIFFPFAQANVWLEALLFFTALAGAAISLWGLQFLATYPLPTLLLIFAFFPKPRLLAEDILQALKIGNLLEVAMAHSSALMLRVIGKPAFAEGTIVALPPDGAVNVAWGCNGFDMAVTMAVASLIMGILLKQKWPGTLAMMLAGVILALIFNIPRIMLLAFASVYWGQESFDFWHSSWGSQIFTGVLFTVYYYVVMAIVKRQPVKKA